MSTKEPFSESIYEEQTHVAEQELSAFLSAVTRLYGPEQGRDRGKGLARRIRFDGQPASIYSPGLARRNNCCLSSTRKQIEHCSAIRKTCRSRPLISRYRRYHRPIVLPRHFCCDVFIAGYHRSLRC